MEAIKDLFSVKATAAAAETAHIAAQRVLRLTAGLPRALAQLRNAGPVARRKAGPQRKAQARALLAPLTLSDADRLIAEQIAFVLTGGQATAGSPLTEDDLRALEREGFLTLARLPLILSEGHLRELALTGKDIDSERAARIGLVNDVYETPEATLAAAHATAAEIAANPPLVVQGIKDVLDEQRTAQVAASLRYVAAWNSAFLPSKDLGEGIKAMFEKRPPQFTGE